MNNKKSVVVIMSALKRLTNEYSGQVGEDEGLYEGNQYFYQINEYRKQYR
jgi:hypothetical protein